MTREAIPPVARYALIQLDTFSGRKTLTSLVFESRVGYMVLAYFSRSRCRCDKDAEERVHIEMHTVDIPPMDW